MIRIQLLFVLLICLGFNALKGQTISGDINSTKTPQHVAVPKTRLSLIPPAGFTKSPFWGGFQKGFTSLIMVMDFPKHNFYTEGKSLTKEDIEKKGDKATGISDLKVNGYPAHFITYLKPGDDRKDTMKTAMLFFGDSTFVVMLTCSWLKDDDQTGADLIQCMKTVYYDKGQDVSPMASAPFKLDESKSKFKFSSMMLGSYMYTIGGKEIQLFGNKGNELGVIVNVQDVKPGTTLKSLAENALNIEPAKKMSSSKEKNTSTKKVNGLDAYTTEMHYKDGSKKVCQYLLIVKNDRQAVVISGIDEQDKDENINQMRKLAETVTFK